MFGQEYHRASVKGAPHTSGALKLQQPTYLKYPTGEKICRNFNFAISLMANLLNFNSVYYHIFENLSMIAYITKIQKLKFANIYFCELDHSEPGS